MKTSDLNKLYYSIGKLPTGTNSDVTFSRWEDLVEEPGELISALRLCKDTKIKRVSKILYIASKCNVVGVYTSAEVFDIEFEYI